MRQKIRKTNQQGQAMILTVLVLSSTVLSLSAIGSYLMMIRLRVSSNIVNTTKAIYIADAGIECEAYNQLKAGGVINCNDGGSYNAFLYNGGVADPGASYATVYVPGAGAYARSTGSYRNVNRSFRLDF